MSKNHDQHSEYLQNILTLDKFIVSIASAVIIFDLGLSKYLADIGSVKFVWFGMITLGLTVLVILCVVGSYILATRRDHYSLYSPQIDRTILDKKISICNYIAHSQLLASIINSVIYLFLNIGLHIQPENSMVRLIKKMSESEAKTGIWIVLVVTLFTLFIQSFFQSDRWLFNKIEKLPSHGKTMNKSPLLPVGIFTAFYLLASLFFSFRNDNTEFIFYLGIVVVLILIVMLIHRRVHFSQTTLWLLSIWGLLHMMGGLVLLPEGWPFNGDHAVLYSLWLIEPYLKYDQIIHAYGFAVCTLVCWEALRSAVPPPAGRAGKIHPSLGILTLCALGGMGLGAFNEILEFAAVLLIPGTNVGGYINTGWDLVANLVGSAVAAVWIGQTRS